MFPQVGRREIQWDLQRNGGSPAATTERILSGRGLEVVSCPAFRLVYRRWIGEKAKGRRAGGLGACKCGHDASAENIL